MSFLSATESVTDTETVFVNGKRISTANMRYVEVSSDDKLYSLLLVYIAKNSCDAKSFAASSVTIRRNAWDDDNEKSSENEDHSKRVEVKLGLGSFAFLDTSGATLFAVHKSKGEPVGTNCCAELYKSLFVFTEGTINSIEAFFTNLIESSEKAHPGIIDIYGWDIRRQYWRSRSNIRARTLTSVILPTKTKSHIVADIDRFLGKPTKEFYASHGIPYRRSYLLHGVPGAGKTSLIQAIAGHFKRSISFLQPTHPDMTDDSLANAMADLPRNTVVVLEDIDALFGKDRSSKIAKSSLTFSGLLNALDGIGSTSGQLIFMTTNLRDELDPALIRNGRVDFHIHFDYASDEQIQDMWKSYYPSAEHLAGQFCGILREKLEGKPIATAGLQHYFVLHMMSSPEEAIERVDIIIEDLRQKQVPDAETEARASDATSEPADESASVTSNHGVCAKRRVGKDDHSASTVSAASKVQDVHIYIHGPGIDAKAISVELGEAPITHM